jgi:hypothetical protein
VVAANANQLLHPAQMRQPRLWDARRMHHNTYLERAESTSSSNRGLGRKEACRTNDSKRTHCPCCSSHSWPVDNA